VTWLNTNLEQLRRIVSEVSGVDIFQKSRRREIVVPRWLFFHFAKRLGYQLTEISEFSGFHHSSIIHGLNMLGLVRVRKELRRHIMIRLRQLKYVR